MSFSTPHGIAAVSYVLKAMLDVGMANRSIPVSDLKVSVLPPDKAELAGDDNRLNLFMYMATPNSGWRNNMLPARDSKGDLVQNQPLALDLHYLMSAYGNEELLDDIVLGFGMQVLHDNPTLSREIIASALSVGSLPSHLKSLATSNLASQIEYIRVTPEVLNTEEISRLWSAFGAKYRSSAVYKVTVVLMQSRRPSKTALPVQQRNLYVMPFQHPVIEQVASMKTENDPPLENRKILEGNWLELRGYDLRGDIVRVQIGDKDDIVPSLVEADRIRFQIIPGDFKAGIQVVQIVHKINMGTPPEAHVGVTSNAALFLLSPVFTDVPTLVNNGKEIQISSITPAIRKDQKVEILLNRNTTSGPAPAYQFQMPTDNTIPDAGVAMVRIPVKGVAAGKYIVRLRVDNAESPLDFPPKNFQQITIP